MSNMEEVVVGIVGVTVTIFRFINKIRQGRIVGLEKVERRYCDTNQSE